MKSLQFLFIFTFLSIVLSAQVSQNVELLKQFDRGSNAYSGSWIYTNDQGEEYGLVGSNSGVAAYPLEEGNNQEVGFVMGPTSRWREITVIKDHAYVTTEGNGENQGLQVLNLSQLPDTMFLETTFDSTFTRGHILQKDIFNPDAPYIYVAGTDSTGGVHILDVSDPSNPIEVGRHDPPAYIHDIHVRGDRMYTFQFSAAIIEVIDISDKTNPVVLTTIDDPGASTHSGWTTMDNNYLLVADERNGFDGRVFDIRDLDNVFEVSTFTANPEAFVHNPYVRGDFAYLAHNREGLRVYDVLDPTHPVEVGFYDTVTEENPGSGGLWSACPFIPSGKVIGGDRDLGLMVWEINEVYASRFNGVVRDEATLEELDGVTVTIMQMADTLLTNAFGTYQGGYPEEGQITLRFEKEGYVDEVRTISLVAQENQFNEVLMETGINVSTSDLANEVQFKAWPNPADKFINVVISETPTIDIEYIEIMNINGKVVGVETWNGLGTAQLSVKNFPSGLYIVRLVNAAGKAVGRMKVSIH